MVLSRIRAGERDAFAHLVDATWADLVDHLTWILASRESAEDVAQEAFVRLWEKRERWQDGSGRALVFRIARNLAFDLRRRERVHRDWATRESAVLEVASSPDDPVEASECERAFRKALACLTRGRREVIELVRLRGLTHREAAEALEISQQTVANRMTLALADLRVLLVDVLPSLETEPPMRSRESTDG